MTDYTKTREAFRSARDHAENAAVVIRHVSIRPDMSAIDVNRKAMRVREQLEAAISEIETACAAALEARHGETVDD